MKQLLKYDPETFATFLHGQGLSESSISEHLANIGRFGTWVDSEGLTDIKTLNYNELMAYVQFEKSKGVQPQSINLHLNSLTKFYDHLRREGYIERNPARRIRVKNVKKTVVKNRLTMEEMEQILATFSARSKFREQKHRLSHQRNIVMLGLAIYQGAATGEFKNMQVIDIRLVDGTVYIPGTGRSRGRKLKLHPSQVLAINLYLTETRPSLSPVGDELFSGNVNNIVWLLIQELKAMFPMVDNINQFKSSVLMHWLKIHGKRKSQYMIGHKYISSTEKYEVQDLDSLQEGLGKHHPFG